MEALEPIWPKEATEYRMKTNHSAPTDQVSPETRPEGPKVRQRPDAAGAQAERRFVAWMLALPVAACQPLTLIHIPEPTSP